MPSVNSWVHSPRTRCGGKPSAVLFWMASVAYAVAWMQVT